MMMEYHREKKKKNNNYLIHVVNKLFYKSSFDRQIRLYIRDAIILLLGGEKYYYRIVYNFALLFLIKIYLSRMIGEKDDDTTALFFEVCKLWCLMNG